MATESPFRPTPATVIVGNDLRQPLPVVVTHVVDSSPWDTASVSAVVLAAWCVIIGTVLNVIALGILIVLTFLGIGR